MHRAVRLLIPVAVVFAASCGAPDETAQPSSAPIGGASGTELAAVQVLHRGNAAEPQTLDPHRAEGVPESNILRDLFEGLIDASPSGELIPGVAERWERSEDGRTYRFTLRADARWSNGDPVTAADFEFSMRRTVDPATLSRYASILFPIVNAEAIVNGDKSPETLGVTAVNERELEIRLNAPTPYLLGLLTHSTTYPVHAPTVTANEGRFARPGQLVSNGAYVLDEWVVQSHIRLRRNPNYWNNDKTTINEVWYYPLENQDAELKRYRAGELQIANNLPYNQLTWMRENIPNELRIAPYFGSYYFGLNLTRPPFAGNRELRAALAMAIDRQIITEKVTGAGEIAAYGWVPPIAGYAGQQPEWAQWSQAERDAEAERLYAQAGYGEEAPLTVELLYNTSENHKRVAAAIASMWKQTLGVNTRLVNKEWKVFLDTRAAKETEVFRAGWIGDYADAYSFAQLKHSTNVQNDSGYKSDRYDALLDAAAAEPNPALRADLMQQAEAQLLEDLPIIPVYFYVSRHLVKPWVTGWENNVMDQHRTRHLAILKH